MTLACDGTRVAVATSVPDVATNTYLRDVVTGPVDGDAPLVPVDPAGSARLPRWSPVDARLVWVVHGAGGREVRVADPAGGTAPATVVRAWPDPVEELAWSPDGSRLLFVVREPLDRAWYALPEDRRPPRRLTTLGHREDAVGWTVDRPRQAYTVALAGGEPARLQPLGGTPRPLTGPDLQHGSPVPSPDGSLLALTTTDIAGFPAATHLAVLDPSVAQKAAPERVFERLMKPSRHLRTYGCKCVGMVAHGCCHRRWASNTSLLPGRTTASATGTPAMA